MDLSVGDQIFIVEGTITEDEFGKGFPCYTIEKHGGVRIQNPDPSKKWKLDIHSKLISPC